MIDNITALSTAFSKKDEGTLEQQLGTRLAAASVQPNGAAFDVDFSANAADLGIVDDAKELGRRLYVRLSREMHDLVCGTAAADAGDREKIRKAIGLGDGLIAVLTGVLVSSFGLMPAIAAIVAALLAKRIFEPAGAEFCQFWSEKLPK